MSNSTMDGHRPLRHRNGLSRAEIAECIMNDRRVRVVELLDENDSISLSDLAEQIASEEYDVEISQLTSDQRKRVYVGLYQCHLPKLRQWSIIDMTEQPGRETHILRRGPNHGTVLEAINFFDGFDSFLRRLVRRLTG